MRFRALASVGLAAGTMLLNVSFAPAASPFHIGIVTKSSSQSEDNLDGVGMLIKEYGEAESGGMIKHIPAPDGSSSQEDYITEVVALANDPLIKAIIVNQAMPGTAEAFNRIKAKRPDIYTLAGEPYEDSRVIAKSADFVTGQDFISRGYLLVWAARQMGARAIVYISFPRHISIESQDRRRSIMEAACKDLGMQWAYEIAPDPASQADAQQFIRAQVPVWLKQYGPHDEKVAMFCTSSTLTGPLIEQLLASKNGIDVEMDLPSPLISYPGTIGLDLRNDAGNFPAILDQVKSAIIKQERGRIGAWASSYDNAVTAGLGEYALRVISGNAKRNNLKDLLTAYAKWTPGAHWHATLLRDGFTHKNLRNYALLYMDTYAVNSADGRKFISTANVKIPHKFFTMKWTKPVITQ
jgi:hypothetical protein